jgi:proline iminopeptidase
MPHLVGELDRHRAALGPETVAMMQRFEATGNLTHPAYQAAITILNYRHVFRNDDWPKTVQDAFKRLNMDIYGTMQGPNEFLYVGNLKDWNRIPDMPKISVPTLIMCGQHDELTPACSMRMHNTLPDSEITVFPNCSHMAMYEDPQAYLARVARFLGERRGRGKP